MAAASIKQANLDTSSAEVSTTNTSWTSKTLAGAAEYTFFPEIKESGGSGNDSPTAALVYT